MFLIFLSHRSTLLLTRKPQIVVSPKNFFLFTPLLPSVAVGTLNPRSIIQSIRYITRHKTRNVSVIEAEATEVDVCAIFISPLALFAYIFTFF